MTRWNGKSGPKESRHTDRIRRVSNRMGSVLRRQTDRGILVQTGKRPPHQLSGATSGNASCKVVPEKSGKQTCSAVDRKPHSSRVHQQPGRNSIPPSDTVGERALDVVPGERNANLCTVSPGRGEYQSRHRILSDERLLGLDAEPSAVPMDTALVSRRQR